MRIAFHGESPFIGHAALLAARALRAECHIHPLVALLDDQLRRKSDLSVLIAGPTKASVRRAVTIATLDAYAANDGLPPLWLLLCHPADQKPPALDLPRILPVRLPVLPERQSRLLDARELPADIMRIAARLGTVLALAAADPCAARLEPAPLKAAFAGLTAADLDLRARLIELASWIEGDPRPKIPSRRATLHPRYLRADNRRPLARHDTRPLRTCAALR